MSNGFLSRREHRRVVRLITEHPLRVVIGSIGNEIRYEMVTRNVSYTGFFLRFDKPGRFPFTPASILDVWLELEQHKFLFFNGKMARIVYPEDATASENGPGIAIRIVQITAEADHVLKTFIDQEIRKQKENPPPVDKTTISKNNLHEPSKDSEKTPQSFQSVSSVDSAAEAEMENDANKESDHIDVEDFSKDGSAA